ncbi:cyclic nucleotide-binding domain-containing protein 2-like [Gastrophryne carolinensis]
MTDFHSADEKNKWRRFYNVATSIKHVCGMLLSVKRYIGRNSVVEWALFNLQIQIHSSHDLLFNISSFSKNNMRKDFEKLKSLLSICPKQRAQDILRQIQLCLKHNRMFQGLPDRTQLELCRHFMYQQYEPKTLVIKKGHIPLECYIILSGTLAAVTKNPKSGKEKTLYEVEEGDIVGDIGLVTGERLISFVCESEVEVLVIDKEVFREVLAAKITEEYLSLCNFLRSLPLFSSWPSEKVNLLVHCSLRRNYRAGTTVVSDSSKSSFLVLVKSGRCYILVHLTPERPSTSPGTYQNYCSIVRRLPSLPFLLQKKDISANLLERSSLHRTSFSASYRSVANPMHMRPRPQTAEPSTFSLRHRSKLCDLDGTDQTLNDKEGSNQKKESAVPSIRFATVGILEQGGVFGMAEAIEKTSNLRFSLVSEGADCIFLPAKLFVAEAPVKSKQVAQELVSSFPTEMTIRECYATLQTWSAYKKTLLRKPLHGLRHWNSGT